MKQSSCNDLQMFTLDVIRYFEIHDMLKEYYFELFVTFFEWGCAVGQGYLFSVRPT